MCAHNIGEGGLAQKYGDGTNGWLKYAPSAVAEQVEKVQSGSLPKIDSQFQNYIGQPLLSTFQETFSEKEYCAA